MLREKEKVQGPSLHTPGGQSKGDSSSGSGGGVGGGGNEPVKARTGACATFILNFPMGNSSDTRNIPSSISGATASTSSASSVSLGPSSISGKEKSNISYAEKMRLMDEKNKEVEMRLSRLSPSFDATQQVRTQQNASRHLT